MAHCARKLRSAEQRATTDGLTGLLNRRSFDERLVELLANAGRHREPMALLMLDIDKFKSVNDDYGHPAGDVALRFVADRVRRVLRLGDNAFRYGGEEFAVLLRKCDAAGAVGVYDRLREELKREPVSFGAGRQPLVSPSAAGSRPMERERLPGGRPRRAGRRRAVRGQARRARPRGGRESVAR